MRPRTATIQVSKDDNLWNVEIGDSKKSAPEVTMQGRSVTLVTINAIITWLTINNIK